MKAFVSILITSWLITLFLPWWGILIPAVIFGAWLTEHSFSAFFIGFFATGSAWFLQAFYIHLANDAILSTRIAEMLGAQSPWMVLLATFLVGAIPGGLGCLMGYLFKVSTRQTSDSDDTVAIS